MIDEPTTPLVIRLATPEDIGTIEQLDSFSTSPTRHIPRAMEKYFGSVDPSTHERTLIFLAEVAGVPLAKAELMLPPTDIRYRNDDEATYPENEKRPIRSIGYIKRVVVHPDARKQGLAGSLIQHIINYARTEEHLDALDLHVWEGNIPAIRLYEALGFELQHRELYFRLPLQMT